MLGCVYEKVDCPYEIDPVCCSIGDMCATIGESGFASLGMIMKKLDLLTRSMDGLVELGFVSSSALEWLMLFEDAETQAAPEKRKNGGKTRLKLIS